MVIACGRECGEGGALVRKTTPPLATTIRRHLICVAQVDTYIGPTNFGDFAHKQQQALDWAARDEPEARIW